MSHHSDEQQLLAVSSDSFWEPGNYKRTTKRIDDGNRLCADLAALVAERSDIEKAYAKSLRGWAKKWNDLIEKGAEYGTMEAAWKGVLVEADRLAELHVKVRDNLVNDVITQIKNWQKETYHKSMIQLKERKEMDEAFKKAQKPWAKLLQKVERARLEYHAACKQERTAHNQERNACGDSSFSPDQKEAVVKKMAERVAKSKEEVAKCREKYQAALAEINAYNPRYMEDMGGVFERCQGMEAQRLVFFKEVLFNIHKCLNISQDPVLPQIYDEFHHTITNADHQKDLKWWANNHGVNMAMSWPQFEEYTEEFRDITKGKSKDGIPSGPITLIHQRQVGDELQELPPPNSNASMKTTSRPQPTANSNEGKTISAPITVTIGKVEVYACPCCHHTFRLERLPERSRRIAWNLSGAGTSDDWEDEEEVPMLIKTNCDLNGSVAQQQKASSPGSKEVSPKKANAATQNQEQNPFDEDEWDSEDGGGVLQDTGEPGVPVRALYDYTGAESDELTFRQGDLFEKLEDEDEQGWCKGRKDGRVGLYPANYVEPVGH